MSGPEHSLVKYRSGSGFMEIDLHAPNGELSRLSLVMEAGAFAFSYQLVGYGQVFYPERPGGEQKLFVVVADKNGREGYVTIMAAASEADEIIKEFRRHVGNKKRRDRDRQRREVEAKKLEVVE